MSKKRSSSSGKSVPVVLEKGEEKPKTSVLQVPPETLQAIKNASQLEEETLENESKHQIQANRDYYRNKALFYVGVFGTVGALLLLFRYFKRSAPPAAYVEDLVNGTLSVVGNQ